MPNRCKTKTGSFSAHLDELVKHFPRETPAKRSTPPSERTLKEQRDIHAILFERAWQIEQNKS